MKKVILGILISFCLNAFGQSEQGLLEMSDKYFVVVGVIAIIFLLIAFYLIRIDKKITQLEQKKS